MLPFTTPTIQLEVEGISGLDLRNAIEIVVTLTQGALKMVKTKEDMTVEERSVGIFLSEAESSQLSDNVPIKAQMNYTFLSADQTVRRGGTDPALIPVGEQDYKEMMIDDSSGDSQGER